jgi:hypothetical protein
MGLLCGGRIDAIDQALRRAPDYGPAIRRASAYGG